MWEYKQTRAQLNEFMEIESLLEQEAERRLKSEMAKQVIANFQERDFSHLQYKVSKTRTKQMEKEERERRMLENSRLRVEVKHDPTRLYRMTDSWKKRVTTPRSESCDPIIIQNMPRLAVPSWRQNV